MQVDIWKVKYSFCVCAKSESLLPKHTERKIKLKIKVDVREGKGNYLFLNCEEDAC